MSEREIRHIGYRRDQALSDLRGITDEGISVAEEFISYSGPNWRVLDGHADARCFHPSLQYKHWASFRGPVVLLPEHKRSGGSMMLSMNIWLKEPRLKPRGGG